MKKAGFIDHALMTLIKAYYVLTAYVPRKLPRTEEEFMFLRSILIGCYDVKDEAPTWMTVAGQITSTPGHKLRKPWGHIANSAKRLGVNKLAQSYRMAFEDALKKSLEDQTKVEVKRLEDEESTRSGLETPKEASIA